MKENKLIQKKIWSHNFIEHSATKRHEHEPHMTQEYFTQEYFGVKWKEDVVQNQPHSLTPATPKFQQFLNN